MKQEILTPKLAELESRLSQLTRRIYLSQEESLSRLEAEIQNLSRESALEQNVLELQLSRSRAEIAPILQGIYRNIQIVLQEGTHLLEQQNAGPDQEEAALEEKILLAEYALDFAVQTADHALLASLKAIAAQRLQEESERSNS